MTVRLAPRPHPAKFSTLVRLGLSVEEWHKVDTQRQRHGANGNLSVDAEDVIILRKVPA